MSLPVIGDVTSFVEFYVHHEDIRRANGLGPRAAVQPLEATLTGALRRMAPILFRRSRVGVRLQLPGAVPYAVKSPTGPGLVTLVGRPGELLLVGYGRARVAEVERIGDPAGLSALDESSLGLI